MRRWAWYVGLSLVLTSGGLAIVGGRLHSALGDTLFLVAAWLIMLPIGGLFAAVAWLKFVQLYEPIQDGIGSLTTRRRGLVRVAAGIAACLLLVVGTWLHFTFAAQQDRARAKADCTQRVSSTLSSCADGDDVCRTIRNYSIAALCDK